MDHVIGDRLQEHDAVAALDRIVGAAAAAVGCPVAMFFRRGLDGFTLCARTGFDVEQADVVFDTAILDQAASPATDGLLIINDMLVEPGSPVPAGAVFCMGVAPLRFVAAARVAKCQGLLQGVLVVADTVAHAGLSPARTYMLRTQAMQIAALLDPALPQHGPDRLRLIESVVVHATDAVLVTEAELIDLPGPRIVYCNAAFTRTTGYEEDEIVGLTPRILQSAETDRAVLDRMRQALSRWEAIEVELFNRRKDGSGFWVELSVVPVADETGFYTHWISVQRDVSERKRAEEAAVRVRIEEAEARVLEQAREERRRVEAQLSFAAFRDALTRLGNRADFMKQLAATLHPVAPGGQVPTILFLDLDRFRLVNETLGHRSGDLLLMEVAQRLRGCIRSNDTLARMGGDEFAVLIEDCDDVRDAVCVAERVIASMRAPVWLEGRELFCSCSIGVARAMPRHRMPEDLVRDADIAMGRAKRQEPGSWAVSEEAPPEGGIDALALQTDLRNAVARQEFVLRYQPIWHTRTGAIAGFEALVRWQHPERGLLSPAHFIQAAEETGLIRAIGRLVLAEACRQMVRWRELYPALTLQLSVNSSGIELRDGRFVAGVQAILAETGFDPRRLQLEITESVFLEQLERIEVLLSALRSSGVRVALDDFGTGYSSLSYLDRYPLDSIKIDRSFVARMLSRPGTMVIVDSIIRLGQALDLTIIAEGVETEAQLRSLDAAGCGFVQGYLLGMPMAEDEAGRLLIRQQAAVAEPCPAVAPVATGTPHARSPRRNEHEGENWDWVKNQARRFIGGRPARSVRTIRPAGSSAGPAQRAITGK